MPEEDLVELKFRLYDGSDLGPFRYSPASTVAMLKERIVAEWPKYKKIAPKAANDVKLISAGKILENSKTVAQCKMPFGELPKGVITMHAVVHPSLAKAKTGGSKTWDGSSDGSLGSVKDWMSGYMDCSDNKESTYNTNGILIFLARFSNMNLVAESYRRVLTEKKIDEMAKKNICSCSIL